MPLSVYFEVIDRLFVMRHVQSWTLLPKEKDRDGTWGTFLRVNLVPRSTEILTTAERENPIARKVEKPRFFAFEWCFPLWMMEYRVAFHAHPREKGYCDEEKLLNGIGRSGILIQSLSSSISCQFIRNRFNIKYF